MLPSPENLASLLSHLNLNKLAPTVLSGTTGKSIENPLVTKFKNNADRFKYTNPEKDYADEIKMLRSQGCLVDKAGQPVVREEQSSRILSHLMLQFKQLGIHIDTSSEKDITALEKMRQTVLKFSIATKISSGEMSTNMGKFISDALAEVGWDKIKVENLPNQLIQSWLQHINRLAPDFDLSKTIDTLEKEKEAILPLTKTLWNHVQTDQYAFLYDSDKPQSPNAKWGRYTMSRLEAILRNSNITDDDCYRTKSIVAAVYLLFAPRGAPKVDETRMVDIVVNSIALSIALQHHLKPVENPLVKFLETSHRKDVPFDLDFFERITSTQQGLKYTREYLSAGLGLGYLNDHPELLELSAQALVWGAAAQTLVDKIFTGLEMKKPHAVELLGGIISDIGTHDYPKHRNLGALLEKVNILKAALNRL